MATASLSLDLDNEWCFMQTNGDARWKQYPTYLPVVVPRILEFLERHGLRITFFIVGQDAARDENQDALKAIVRAGHEIGNHSFRHQPWLHEYSLEEIDQELANAEAAIRSATGVTPIGFRAPGYSYSPDTVRVLASRGYEYDCSSFPNSVNALARIYFFNRSTLPPEEKKRRKELFGKTTEMFRPLKPYFWTFGQNRILEIPVTTMPVTRLPIHFSYVLYLGKFSKTAALAYFAASMDACRVMRVEPSLLFHPLDFLGCDDGFDTVKFFPGMDIEAQRKIDILTGCVEILRRRFDLVTMIDHARRITNGKVPEIAAGEAH